MLLSFKLLFKYNTFQLLYKSNESPSLMIRHIPLTFSLLTLSASAEFQAGQTIGVDFSTAAGVQKNFIAAPQAQVHTAPLTHTVDGETVSGVTINLAGFTGHNADAVVKGEEPSIFAQESLDDWFGFSGNGATVTFSGLNDKLTYEICIGGGSIHQETQSRYSVADQASIAPDQHASNPFGVMKKLKTDGSGNLAISITSEEQFFSVSALTITAKSKNDVSSLISIGNLSLVIGQ